MITLETLTHSFGAFSLMFCLAIPFIVNKSRMQSVYFSAIYVVVIAHMAIYVAIKLNLKLSDFL